LKTLSLLAPDFAALDSIWRHPLPFVLWPVGHQGLIDHWIDESVRRGAVEIRIYAVDRPAEIRRHLSAGGYWSRRAKVTAIRTELDAPSEAIPMDRLPQQDQQEIRISESHSLLSNWLEMQRFWLTHRDRGRYRSMQRSCPMVGLDRTFACIPERACIHHSGSAPIQRLVQAVGLDRTRWSAKAAFWIMTLK
jgi:hypothetical protein